MALSHWSTCHNNKVIAGIIKKFTKGHYLVLFVLWVAWSYVVQVHWLTFQCPNPFSLPSPIPTPAALSSRHFLTWLSCAEAGSGLRELVHIHALPQLAPKRAHTYFPAHLLELNQRAVGIDLLGTSDPKQELYFLCLWSKTRWWRSRIQLPVSLNFNKSSPIQNVVLMGLAIFSVLFSTGKKCSIWEGKKYEYTSIQQEILEKPGL